jgi:hypothetical protein
VSRIRKMTFYLKYIIGLLNGSKLIETKIIIKKYLNRSFPTEFLDSTQNYNKMAGILNRKCVLSTLKAKSTSKFRIVATWWNLKVWPKILKKKYRNTKSTNQNEHFRKKKNVKSVKEQKIRKGPARRETTELKLNSESEIKI